MDVFSILSLCGGLALFLYGMNVMSTGLERMAGGKLESMLKRMTSSPLKSLLLGLGVTAAIQSSSAMTVMLVGLVNSGIMQLRQTIGVIMGSNIGTTMTAWILSLAGIESDNVWVQLLKPESFSPVLAAIGVVLIMVAKSDRKKSAGSVLIGFAVLMYGMEFMKNAVAPLTDNAAFSSLLTAFNNPLLGVLVGAVFTGIIQSSSASVGILQALATTGSITYGMAFPIIMGQNIGTCATALISSVGVNRNAKKVAVVHVSFNLIGTGAFLIIFYLLHSLLQLPIFADTVSPVGIAACHSIFNIATTTLLLPFSRMLEKIANTVVRDNQQTVFTFLDERLTATPSVAIAECENKTCEMAKLSQDSLMTAIRLLKEYDPALRTNVLQYEDLLDQYEDKLGTYLVTLSGKQLSDEDSKRVSKQLHTIGDFERIGDHAVNLLKVSQEMEDKQIAFSGEAQEELDKLIEAITEILRITTNAFLENDVSLARQVEPLEQVIDRLIAEIKSRHIRRLQAGSCTIIMGFVLSDLLTNFERVSDHCSNVAVALIETEQNAFKAHEYLNDVKYSGNPEFEDNFRRFAEVYQLES